MPMGLPRISLHVFPDSQYSFFSYVRVQGVYIYSEEAGT